MSVNDLLLFYRLISTNSSTNLKSSEKKDLFFYRLKHYNWDFIHRKNGL